MPPLVVFHVPSRSERLLAVFALVGLYSIVHPLVNQKVCLFREHFIASFELTDEFFEAVMEGFNMKGQSR